MGTDIPRGICHQAVRCLGLGEGDDVPDRGGAGHQHHQPVKAKGQATVGRGAVLQGSEQETEFFFRLGFVDLQDAEYGLLHIALENTDTATAQFTAVEHHVIGPRQRPTGVGDEFFYGA